MANRILFISDEHPRPGYGGGERVLSIYNALNKLAEVHLLIVAWPHTSPPSFPRAHVAFRPSSPDLATPWYWRKRKYLLGDLRVDREIADVTAKLHRDYRFDAFFGTEESPLLADCTRLGPSFVDLNDLGTQPAKWGFNPVDRLKLLVLRNGLAKFQRVFVTKPRDAAYIGTPNVQVLPCVSTQRGATVTVDPISSWVAGDAPCVSTQRGVTVTCNRAGDGYRILFVGSRWPPNQEGLLRFVERSLPIIRHHLPSATLRVVGSHDDGFVNALREHDGVVPAGFVPDLAVEYSQADICICPIWRGTGSQVKLAEYASFSRAVVATTFSALGYDGILKPGRDLLVADTDAGIAAHCVELLKNERRRRELARSAGKTAETFLSQTAIDRIIGDAIGTAPTVKKGKSSCLKYRL